MTVAQLIGKLEKYPEDMEVWRKNEGAFIYERTYITNVIIGKGYNGDTGMLSSNELEALPDVLIIE